MSRSRKFLLGLGGVILVALVGFFTLGPGIVESDMNRVDGQELIPV